MRLAKGGVVMLAVFRGCAITVKTCPSDFASHAGDATITLAVGVFVVAAPPCTHFVAPLRCPIEPLVHAPKTVESARIGRIRVVNDAVLERKGAHARPLARIGGNVGAARSRHLGHGSDVAAHLQVGRLPSLVVVFDTTIALLILSEPDIEVGIEVAAEG